MITIAQEFFFFVSLSVGEGSRKPRFFIAGGRSAWPAKENYGGKAYKNRPVRGRETPLFFLGFFR
jgi:hypothetical protein